MARVLVIDDQKIPRAAVGAMLTGAGYEVAGEPSGPAGIERARSWRPDVIVLDVHMPGMDGFEVVERLKQDPQTAPVPVIFLTAESPSDALVVRGLDLGAYDFLNKGCSRAELLARVGAMARIKRSHDEISALARLSGVLVESLDPAQLAERLTREVAQALRADAALLVLPGDARRTDVRAGCGLSTTDPRFYALVDALFEAVPAPGPEGDAQVLTHAAELAGGAELPFRSAASVCVQRPRRRPLLLAVLAEREGAFGHAGDPGLLGLLARQATLALDNALLHAQTRGQAETMEEQAAQLEQAMTERSRFFASMSHELRTPINAIIGYAELLRDGIYGGLADGQQGAVERVVGSARHLLELVNDVLDISKLEAGKLEILPQETDVAELLRDISGTVELAAREKGLELAVDAPEALPVFTDPQRVRQIVLNLLSNAVKFTDGGAVRATLTAADGGWAEVRVSDTGPGVKPEDRERIFNEFEQTVGASNRGGTGLGLAISLRLAKLLGGTLRLESASPEGSVFLLRLPPRTPQETIDHNP